MSTAFSYIADINPPEKRFFRIMFIEIGTGAGILVGQIFFGWLIEYAGFVVPAVVFTVAQTLLLIYTIFFLPETVRRNPEVNLCTCASLSALPRLWFRDKDARRRMVIWISSMLIFTTALIQESPQIILTFFFLDPPLCWSSLIIGIYNGVSFVMRVIGGLLLMRFMYRRAPDAALQAISLLSAASLFLCLALATETWIPFLGALFAGLAFSQLLSMLIGSTVINLVYAKTPLDHRGLIFLVLMSLLAVPLFLVGLGWHFERWWTKQKEADACYSKVSKTAHHSSINYLDCNDNFADVNQQREEISFSPGSLPDGHY